MMGWKGEDLSPNQDGSIERIILEQSDKRRTPSDGAFVKGLSPRPLMLSSVCG